MKRKIQKTQVLITLLFFWVMGTIMVQAQTQSVSSWLNNMFSEIKSTVQMVFQIASLIAGVYFAIRSITIFMGQGSGEEKIQKAGTWLFLLIFCVLAFMFLPKLFNMN